MNLSNDQITSILSMGGNKPPERIQRQPDRLQLKMAMKNMNQATMMDLVQKARSQGISDDEIEKGLEFLLKL